MSEPKGDWLDAQKASTEALALAKNAMASERANLHITMLILATLARTAPKDAVDKLHAEFERIRDLSGPAGAVANEIFAAAVSTLERHSRRD
jgi:3-hydroxy-3-methylglutaryl CoA synthase